MACGCLNIDTSFNHQKELADSFFKETGEVCIVYESSKGKFTWTLKKGFPESIKIWYETV